MIKCDIFVKHLNDLFEGRLSEKMESEMEGHIKECPECSKLYENEKAVDNVLWDTFHDRKIYFRSSREMILKGIDKDRYSRNRIKRLYLNIKRNYARYLSCAALIVVCVFSYPLIADLIGADSGMPGNDKPVPRQTGEMNTAGSPDVLTISETLLPLPDKTNNNEAAAILEKIKDKEIGPDRWNIIYSKGSRVIFYNSPGLLAYSNDDDKGEYYGAVDLEKINCNYMSGETITVLEASPDGNSVVIWNWDVEALVDGNTNVYIYDLASNKPKIFKRYDKTDIVGAWSRSSQYYVFGDKNGRQMTIFDNKGESHELPLNIGILKQVFVSNSGDIIAVSDKNYLIRNVDGKYVTQQMPISGEILGFTRSGSISYFENDTVYGYESGNSSVLMEIGSGFRIVNPYKFTGIKDMEHPIFSNGVSTIVYESDKSFYSYDFGYNSDRYLRFSEDCKKCFITSDFIDAEVRTFDRQKAGLKSSGPSDMLACRFLNNESLVRIVQKDNSIKLGDFMLIKNSMSY